MTTKKQNYLRHILQRDLRYWKTIFEFEIKNLFS